MALHDVRLRVEDAPRRREGGVDDLHARVRQREHAAVRVRPDRPVRAAGAAVVVAYATWVLYVDGAPRRCGRALRWLQLSRYARWLGGYFPIDLRKASPDADFGSDGVYLFGYHPHGIISVGCFTQFAFDGSGASKLFPGLRFHCATLTFNFKVPFFRELLLALGIIEVSARSIKNALDSGPGAAVVIVPGGASESLDASPGNDHVLTLRRRNGFFRIALQHGANLVPVFSFGENDLYGVVSPTGPVRRLQAALLRAFGYAVPVYLGAGSNAQTWGSPIPLRRPIITVVGDPIKCPRIDQPTQEEIEAARIARKLAAQNSGAKGGERQTAAEKLKAEQQKQRQEKKKSKAEQREDLCELLGRGC